MWICECTMCSSKVLQSYLIVNAELDSTLPILAQDTRGECLKPSKIYRANMKQIIYFSYKTARATRGLSFRPKAPPNTWNLFYFFFIFGRFTFFAYENQRKHFCVASFFFKFRPTSSYYWACIKIAWKVELFISEQNGFHIRFCMRNWVVISKTSHPWRRGSQFPNAYALTEVWKRIWAHAHRSNFWALNSVSCLLPSRRTLEWFFDRWWIYCFYRWMAVCASSTWGLISHGHTPCGAENLLQEKVTPSLFSYTSIALIYSMCGPARPALCSLLGNYWAEGNCTIRIIPGALLLSQKWAFIL
jgi:hypothetical protein